MAFKVHEGYNTVQWRHFDNDDRRYEAYVLIDESDGAIIYNYQVWPGDYWLDILNDAIEDAREYQRHNKYGSYGVYGCMNNEYDESTRVFITNGLTKLDKIMESKNFIDDSTIVINNEDYSLVEFDYIYDLYDATDELNNGEAFYWHGGRIIYKDYDGRIMACYQDDHDNCWEI